MKPVNLQFKGLNSFSEKTEIDFTPLLQSGIFGIFGETGSGKSTILDAINFALYGDIERNPDKIDKINFRCDELSVRFIFDIFSDGTRRTYIVERSIKRKSEIHKAMLYEVRADGSSVAVADNVKGVNDRITEIIGINKEDFRKCIALPQGEFAQFVDSAPAERIALIERLFSLQKFGTALKEKLSRREKQTEGDYNKLEGKLSAFADDTEEKLAQLKTAADKLQRDAEAYKTAAEKAAADYTAKSKALEEKLACVRARAELEKLEQQRPRYDELKAVLPALPFCERMLESQRNAAAFEEKLARAEEQGKKLAGQIEEFRAKARTLEKEVLEADFDGAVERVQQTLGRMESLLAVVTALDKDNAELEACRAEYAKEKRVYSEREEAYRTVQNGLEAAKLKLSSIPEQDTEEYLRKEFRGGILKDEYARSLNYFKELQDSIKIFDDGSALYKYIYDELGRRAAEYQSLILTVKDAKLNAFEELEKFLQTVKARRTAENMVTELASKLKNAEILLSNSSEKLVNLKKNGEKLKERAAAHAESLKEVFGRECTDYPAAVKRTRAELEELKRRKKLLADKIENINASITDYSGRYAAVQAEERSLRSQLESARLSVDENVRKAGLTEVAQCDSLLKKYDSHAKALDEYNQFIKAYSAAESEVKRRESVVGGSDITEEAVSQSLAVKINAEREYSRISGELAVSISNANALERRLAEKREAEKQFSEVSHRRDLLGKLRSLLRDNKFMEYIANGHLVNIARTASKTLVELTDGRYFLEYCENNFYVGDNYNGGERRKVRTLSGGETFLVSLSLALALGSTICNRSLKSIEFFFLDEGFGTLDGDLIETVLGALEKLKSANFCIGLISHVEELKHRITSKILVSKATESHGSTIKISC